MVQHLINNKYLIRFLAIAWTILIFVGCSLPGRDIPAVNVFDHFDKLVHFTFFFAFAVLWLLVFLAPNWANFNRSIIIIILLSFIYGFGLEYYQINFVPGRAWDVWDGVADGVGGIVGALFYKVVIAKQRMSNL